MDWWRCTMTILFHKNDHNSRKKSSLGCQSHRRVRFFWYCAGPVKSLFFTQELVYHYPVSTPRRIKVHIDPSARRQARWLWELSIHSWLCNQNAVKDTFWIVERYQQKAAIKHIFQLIFQTAGCMQIGIPWKTVFLWRGEESNLVDTWILKEISTKLPSCQVTLLWFSLVIY